MKELKESIFITVAFLIFFNCNYSQENIDSEVSDSIIVWDEFYRLQYEDFLAKKIPIKNKYSLDAVSHIEIHLNFCLDETVNKMYIYVYVEFHKNISWIDSKESLLKRERLDGVLLHEQIHFDIAELVARMIRREIKRKIGKKFKDIERHKVVKIYDDYFNFLGKSHDKFDDETLVDRFFKEIKYGDSIRTEIKKLDEYANSKLEFKYKKGIFRSKKRKIEYICNDKKTFWMEWKDMY